MIEQQCSDPARADLPVRMRSAVAAVLLGLLLVLAGASTASAHATLEGTDPTDGKVLAVSPASLSLSFSESVSLQPRGVRVLDAAGTPIASNAQAVDQRVEITVPTALTAGTYVVSWRVTSADGHPVQGAFNFSVGRATPVTFIPTAAEPSTALTRALQVTNGFGYAGLLLTVGIAAFLVFIAPVGARSLDRARTQLHRLVRITAGVALVGSLVLAPLMRIWQEAGRFVDIASPAMWAEGFTVVTLASPVLVAVGLALVLLGLGPATSARSTRPLVVAGSVMALSSVVVSGHTADGPSVVYPVDLVHVSAAALWLGSVVALAVISRRSSRARAADVATALANFSALALETVIVLAAAGTVMAWLILDSLTELLTTAWGITLIVKVALVSVVVGLAAYNRWRLLPAVVAEPIEARAWTRLRRSLRLEAGALLAVLAVTGVLVTQSPRVETTPPTAATAQPLRGVAAAGDATLTYTVDPVLRGANTVRFTLTDAQGKPLDPSTLPTLRTNYPAQALGPFERKVREVEPGMYEAVLDLDYAGTWRVEVAIRTDKFTSVTAGLDVDVP